MFDFKQNDVMLVFVSSAQSTGVADLGLSGQVVYRRRYCGHTRDLTIYTCAPGCIMMRSRACEGSDEEQQHGTLFSSKGSYLRGYLTSTSLREKQDEENIQLTLLITAAAEWVDAAETRRGMFTG